MEYNKSLIKRFIEYVQIDSVSGEEAEMTERLIKDFESIGCVVTTDKVENTTGSNVYATLKGNSALSPIMFCAHMDTVSPGKSIKPIINKNGYIHTDGTTILGADDKAGICVIIEAMKEISLQEHRTVEAVITVSEESGMHGGLALDRNRIKSKHCVVLDSNGGPNLIEIGAPGNNKINATITGRAAHAGMEPEKGISAIEAAAFAVSTMKLRRVDFETTANIGTFNACGANNVVSERAELSIEVRSRNNEKLKVHTEHIVDCIRKACDHFGATFKYEVSTSCLGYAHSENHPLVKDICGACERIGLVPKTVMSGGATDANVFNASGIAAVNIGVGMENEHTTAEKLNIIHMEQAMLVCKELMK